MSRFEAAHQFYGQKNPSLRLHEEGRSHGVRKSPTLRRTSSLAPSPGAAQSRRARDGYCGDVSAGVMDLDAAIGKGAAAAAASVVVVIDQGQNEGLAEPKAGVQRGRRLFVARVD
ncbi:hypothetical protein NLG97_g10603 [Lecanicillium saksenae]|uniref:Uncharacterized protein n=1 Tax=Lecanicillium saksenae TaxID=468837 RepID=A0ACC1QEE7_9HYPO|nr:hypothetical protein NLG97_g10603 [Lecanicillium saksenae]